jgi:hypothetical protein
MSTNVRTPLDAGDVDSATASTVARQLGNGRSSEITGRICGWCAVAMKRDGVIRGGALDGRR